MNGNFIAPSPATCSALSSLDGGSVFYASRPGYGPTGGNGYYCGSRADIGDRTLENGRKSVNMYGSASYELTEHANLFLDLQAGYTHQDSYKSPFVAVAEQRRPERRFRAGAFLRLGHRPDRAMAADVFHPE